MRWSRARSLSSFVQGRDSMTKICDGIWKAISHFGRKIVQACLTASRFGNINVIVGDQIFITCTGSMLDEIGEDQVGAPWILAESCSKGVIASTENCVHRAVYQATSAGAIIHTHSPYAVAISLLDGGSIEPVDGEGLYFLGPMPIVAGGFGTEELAKNVSSALTNHRACVAWGHGSLPQV